MVRRPISGLVHNEYEMGARVLRLGRKVRDDAHPVLVVGLVHIRMEQSEGTRRSIFFCGFNFLFFSFFKISIFVKVNKFKK
jgi:hypothetical protein